MLPPDRRLTHRRDIATAVRGDRAGAATVVVHCKSRPTAERSRFAVAVSRRVGSAVVRNRVARRLRHAVAAELAGWDQLGADVVIRALPEASLASSAQLSADLRLCRQRLIARKPARSAS